MQLTLTEARERRGLTQAALAERAGVNKSTVLRVERGDVMPSHSTVVSLEKALGLRPGQLKVEAA